MKTRQSLRIKIDGTLKTWQWWCLAAASWLLFRQAMSWMESIYFKTMHPASVMEGQLAFNGAKIKSYYSAMVEQGTLNDYVFVQLIDFAFMLTMFLAMACMSISAYRSLPNKKWLKNFAWCLVIAASMAPLFDALENFVSFIMLANPEHFPDLLAYPYSTFAAIKYFLSFLGFGWTMIAALVSLSALMYGKFGKLKTRAAIV